MDNKEYRKNTKLAKCNSCKTSYYIKTKVKKRTRIVCPYCMDITNHFISK